MLSIDQHRRSNDGLLGAPISVEVGYVERSGKWRRIALPDAGRVDFEVMAPVRRFHSRKGQRHLPGQWWSATDCAHVGYESWLERDALTALDFDLSVAAIASQPFWLFWVDGDGAARSHAPDYFARCGDGSAVVVDCRPVDRRPARDVASFDATRWACQQVGWRYQLVGAMDPVTVANLRWLAAYRHRRHGVPEMVEPLCQVFAEPCGLMIGAQQVGDPVAVLPVLFHLLWLQRLVTDLVTPLHGTSIVTWPLSSGGQV